MWPFPPPTPRSYIAQAPPQAHLSTPQTRPNIDRANTPDLFCTNSLSTPMEQYPTPPALPTLNTSRARRAPRPAGTLIDLTDTIPIGASSNTQTPRVFPAPKRRKTSQSPTRFTKIEKVDLSHEEDDEFSMKRNREELLKAQGGGDDGKRKGLAGFSCVICMEDEPTDLAATPCGMRAHYYSATPRLSAVLFIWKITKRTKWYHRSYVLPPLSTRCDQSLYDHN